MSPIEGTVKQEGGATLGQTRVCAFAKETALTCDFTTSSGEYQLTELEAGKEYTVAFTGEVCSLNEEECFKEFKTQYYNAQSSAGSAQKVLPGSKNIDATLAPGGAIAGHVTQAPGGVAPLAFALCACSRRASWKSENFSNS